MRINVGCAQTPTHGRTNVDNSLALRLAGWPQVTAGPALLRLIEPKQVAFIEFARKCEIKWANARRLPFRDSSVDVLYTSHIFGHLDYAEAGLFLEEALRVLRLGAILRMAVPDLARLAAAYAESGDADAFIASTRMAVPKPKAFAKRLHLAIVGPRQHHWLYDSRSLCTLLTKSGFGSAVPRVPGATS